MAKAKTSKMPPKKRMGRPPFEPTAQQRQMVEQMVAVGIPRDEIALCLDVSLPTLRRHFKREIATAATKANARVGASLFNKATSGDTGSMIWWTKSRMGWKEKQDLNLSNEDGTLKPTPAVALDLSKLSTETIRELLDAMQPKDDA